MNTMYDSKGHKVLNGKLNFYYTILLLHTQTKKCYYKSLLLVWLICFTLFSSRDTTP